MDDDDARLEALSAAAARHPGLQVLVLHGSRARGEARAGSDWDLACLGSDELDLGALHVTAVSALGTDAVDLVDLERASALLRFRAARDGRCLFEDRAGRHLDFVLAATHFWCDAGPIIRRAQRAVLADLGPR